MAFPTPVPGLVIRYSYLWSNEHAAAQDEGRKDRPCVVLSSTPRGDPAATIVYVIPITHRAPAQGAHSIELPQRVKRHLGLDGERSWIILDEVNDFIWPGFDLRPIQGRQPPRIDHGVLPPTFFRVVREAFIALYRQKQVKIIPRD